MRVLPSLLAVWGLPGRLVSQGYAWNFSEARNIRVGCWTGSASGGDLLPVPGIT